MKDNKKKLTELIPDTWFSDIENSSFWVTGYQIISPKGEQILDGHCFDFDEVRILIFHGEMNYPHFKESPESARVMRRFEYEACASSSTTWLLILQPYIINGNEKLEHAIKRKASSIAGLYAAINGYNMAYERVFDFENKMTGEVSCFTPIIINPNAFPSPNLSEEHLHNISLVANRIDKLEEHNKRRVELSLHWFETGLRSLGLDSFIKYWIAIETLGMPDTSNIKPLNERLAKIYSFDIKKVQAIFSLGRVQNLRSRILHDGEDLSIHQDLSRYMEALFLDILLSYLEAPPAMRALSVVQSPEFNIKKLTHS